MYFHFETLKTYTASLLSLFGDMETQVKHSNGKIHTSRVPIQYSNREKSDIINQLTYEQIFSSNSQVLPRAVLLFVSMAPARERAKNKFVKISKLPLQTQSIPIGKVCENSEYSTKVEYSDIMQYQFNSIPYNFEYQIIVQTRGMSEACQIIEQVCSYFNPSYNMKIAEIPFPGIPKTSVKLELTNTGVEQQEIDEYSTNIVTITFDLTLSGNLYPCVKDSKIVKQIQMFLSTGEQPNRVSSISTDENETILNKYNCVIKDIIFEDNKLKAIFESKCEKLIKFNFEWSINGQDLVYNAQTVPAKLKDRDIVRVRGYTDLTSSDYFEKQFTIDDLKYNITIKDIKYVPIDREANPTGKLPNAGYLEVDFGDLKFIDDSKNSTKVDMETKVGVNENPNDTRYTYTWWIDNIKQKYTNKIIPYTPKNNVNTPIDLQNIKVQIKCKDGRESIIFEKFIN